MRKIEIRDLEIGQTGYTHPDALEFNDEGSKVWLLTDWRVLEELPTEQDDYDIKYHLMPITRIGPGEDEFEIDLDYDHRGRAYVWPKGKVRYPGANEDADICLENAVLKGEVRLQPRIKDLDVGETGYAVPHALRFDCDKNPHLETESPILYDRNIGIAVTRVGPGESDFEVNVDCYYTWTIGWQGIPEEFLEEIGSRIKPRDVVSLDLEALIGRPKLQTQGERRAREMRELGR